MTSVYVHDLPTNASSDELASAAGGKRRVMVIVNGTVGTASQADGLGNWIPNISGVEGVVSNTLNDAVAATALSWSSAVVTVTGNGGSSQSVEYALICTIT